MPSGIYIYNQHMRAQGLRGLERTPSNTSTRGLLLHHSACVHTTVTLDHLEENRVETDVTLCSFFLFPQVKRQLKRKQFHVVDDAGAVVEGVIMTYVKMIWRHEYMVCVVQRQGGLE